ncbi:MAG: hypothetical protein WA730_09870, partial [Pseudolabrys sp.]
PRGQQSLCSLASWDNPLLYAWSALCQRLPSKKAHRAHFVAVLERQWWADAPVNDGLFVRRDT